MTKKTLLWSTKGRLQLKICGSNMSFFQKALTPPPSLLEFSRHFWTKTHIWATYFSWKASLSSELLTRHIFKDTLKHLFTNANEQRWHYSDCLPGRGPQSREQRKHCSRTNSNLMNNFSQNFQKNIYSWRKKKIVKDTDCPWRTENPQNRHSLSITDTETPN